MAAPVAITYKLETILENKTTIDLSRAGEVVTGWRREDGATTKPSLFLRPHLIDKKKELDAFFLSVNKRLYVSGPPGSGKTSFFLLYCAQRALIFKQRGLVVQYRDSSYCEIMIVDDSSICRVYSGQYQIRNNLLAILREIVGTQEKFDFFVFDGVRQNKQDCGDVLAFLNSHFNTSDHKGIHITSLQFSIKAGDGTFRHDQYMSVVSWEFPNYVAAYRAKLFTEGEWRSVLEDDSERKQTKDTDDLKNDDEEMKDGEDGKNGDEQMTDSEDEGEKEYMALLERKFYYAGGSVRFMLDYTLKELISEIFPDLLGQMNTQLWDEFSDLTINVGSESTVNSLMQVLNDKEGTNGIAFPVSKYILHKAYEKCRARLVKAVKAAAMMTDNPALQGWAFELAQIEWINVAI
jgi:hypothetical protein